MQERCQVIRVQIPPEISNDVDKFFALCEANNHCVVQKQVMYQSLSICGYSMLDLREHILMGRDFFGHVL